MEARDIILPAAAITVAVAGASAPASAYDAKLNHPETWGSNCRKIDMPGNVMTYTANGDNVRQVIVKGGTSNKVYSTAPFTNLTSEINPNSGKPYAISHVIICSDDGQGQTAPADDATPTKPSEPAKPTPTKPIPATPAQPNEPSQPATPAVPANPEVLGDTTENKAKDKPTEVKTSSTSTNQGRGVAVQGATTDNAAVAELPETGAGSAAAGILAAGAATYAGARALRKR